MPKTSIVSVNYKSTLLVHELEKKLSEFPVEYVVVDNSGEFTPLLRTTKRVDAGSNIGFGRGCNLGMKHSSGETLVFLNPDITFDQKEFAKFLSFCAMQQEPAVWGPLIRDCRGQVAVLSSPGRLGLAYRRHVLGADDLGRETTEVVYVSGACLASHRSVLEEIGGYSKDIFLYGEDLDLCLRANARGARIFLTNRSEIEHKGGGSSTGMDRFKRLVRSYQGHFTFFRHRNLGPLGSSINALHLASGRRI